MSEVGDRTWHEADLIASVPFARLCAKPMIVGVVAIVLFALAGCADNRLRMRVDHLPDPVAPYRALIDKGAHVDFDQGSSVLFKPGRPRDNDTLEGSIIVPDDQFDRLNGFLAMVIHNQLFMIKVTGFADTGECVEPGCTALSKRRALMIQRILLEKHVSPQILLAPTWLGTTAPLDGSGDEEGRQRNRRVEIGEVLVDNSLR